MSINGDFADSEYGDDFIEQESFSDTTSEKYDAKADKRAHHNALERKRRDHIKDSFSSLKNAVPTFNGEKASRAQILKKAAEYINNMRQKNNDHQKDIDLLKKENKLLEEKIKALEGMKNGHGLN